MCTQKFNCKSIKYDGTPCEEIVTYQQKKIYGKDSIRSISDADEIAANNTEKIKVYLACKYGHTNPYMVDFITDSSNNATGTEIFLLT